MTLERPFRLSILTLVGTGLVALTLALGSLFWLAGGLGLFVACLVVEAVWPRWHLPQWLATLGVVAALQVMVVEVVAAGEALVAAGHFLILTQLLWLSQERTTRHYGWLCLVSLLQMMFAGVLSVDLAFGICLVVYLPVGVLALLLLNLRREVEQWRERGTRVQGRISARLLASAGFVALAELVLTIVVFLYFPRFGLQILQLQPVQKGPALCGFSDEVRLGDIARILDNPEVVMAIRLHRGGRTIQGEEFPLLWRGISLDTYESGTWTTKNFMSSYGSLDLEYPPTDAILKHDPTREVIQEITLEPVNSRVLFHLLQLIEMRKASPNLDRVDIHRESDTHTTAGSSSVSLRYVVRSRLPSWTLEALRRPVSPGPDWVGRLLGARPSAFDWATYYDQEHRFLQLPASLSPRVRALAEEIVAAFPPGQIYDRVRQVETYLKARYANSLVRDPVKPGVDPVEDFLFEQPRGHCEHFAAAMVVLLRSLGIPARLVTGFRGGEWNEYGEFFLVRQQHAHAWVEARVPATRMGWLSFNPTPPADVEPPGEGWLARLSRRLAYLRLTWNSWVVSYSSLDQKRAAESITHFLSNLPNFLPGWGRERLGLGAGVARGLAAAVVLAVLGLLGVGAVVLAVWLRRRTRRGRGWGESAGRPSIGFYRRLDALLRRRGFPRPAAATPLEFAEQVVAEAGEGYASVRLISEAFCRVFYGGRRLSAGERGEVLRALAALEGADEKRKA